MKKGGLRSMIHDRIEAAIVKSGRPLYSNNPEDREAAREAVLAALREWEERGELYEKIARGDAAIHLAG